MEKGDLVVADVFFVEKIGFKRRPFVYFFEDEYFIYGLRITTKIEDYDDIIIIDDKDLKKYKLKLSSGIRYDYICRASKDNIHELKCSLDREIIKLIDDLIS